MAPVDISFNDARPRVVGSFGSLPDLQISTATSVVNSCDLAEIRLDLVSSRDGIADPSSWAHLSGIPLLFTARRADEGGAHAFSPTQRMNLLRVSVEQASLIDVEVASIQEMGDVLGELADRRIPWIASYHNFDQLPPTADLVRAARQALDAGAAVFKAAAKLTSLSDMTRLAEFQLADHGIPVSTMGMGPLAPVSRLLCAQCGSVLNYGYLGDTATAPGQWDSTLLKTAISRLAPYTA